MGCAGHACQHFALHADESDGDESEECYDDIDWSAAGLAMGPFGGDDGMDYVALAKEEQQESEDEEESDSEDSEGSEVKKIDQQLAASMSNFKEILAKYKRLRAEAAKKKKSAGASSCLQEGSGKHDSAPKAKAVEQKREEKKAEEKAKSAASSGAVAGKVFAKAEAKAKKAVSFAAAAADGKGIAKETKLWDHIEAAAEKKGKSFAKDGKRQARGRAKGKASGRG